MNGYEHFTEQDWRDLAAAYATHAISPEDEQTLRRQMMRDQELHDYVERLQETADDLLGAAPEIEPPPALKGSIMRAATEDLRAREAAAPPAQRAGRARMGGAVWKPAIAFACVLVLAVGAYVVGHNSGSQPAMDHSKAVAVTPMANPRAAGELMPIGDGSDGGMLHLRNMKPMNDGRVYQLWVKRGDRMAASSMFEARSDGTATTVVPQDIRNADAVMVTVEPAGGSDVPTSAVQAEVKL